MSKPAAEKQKPQREPADHPSYLRSEVVALFGECPALKKSFYVKRRHIMDVYGISWRHFRNIVDSGALTKKYFVFKQ